MQELLMTPSTVAVLVVIGVLAFCAFCRLIKRGMCDCDGGCDGGCHGKRSGCARAAAEDMVKRMEVAAEERGVW